MNRDAKLPKTDSTMATKRRILKERLIVNEAILLAAISGFCYYTAYFYRKSYLNFFEVSNNFIEIDLIDLIVTASFLILCAVMIIWTGSLFPIALEEPTKNFGMAFSQPIIFLTAFATFFAVGSQRGFTFIIVTILCLSILFIVLFTIRYRSLFMRYIRKELRFSGLVGELNKRQMFALSRLEEYRLLSRYRPPTALVAGIALIMFWPIFVGIAGHLDARNESTHDFIAIGQQSFIVVTSFRDNLVLTEIELIDEEAYLTGNIKLLSFSEASNIRRRKIHLMPRRIEDL